ncbi:MAG: ABC transporter permease [Acetobacteraceae bacterium]|nr:ABC transporter permease [Acetobacteraceae bacterium]
MRIRIESRRSASRLLPWITPPFAVAATVVASAVVFAAMGYAPARTLFAFFVAPLLSVQSLAELALKAGPLVMIAAGLATGFRANVWNIGAEGQLTMGAIAAGGVALAFWDDDTARWILPAMCVAAVLGGMVWAAIPAFLKTRFGVNEILTSLMLTYVASLTLTSLVFGPWKDPEGFNFPQSRMFNDAETLPAVAGTRVTIGTILSFLVPLGLWVVTRYSIVGFEIKAVGLAPAAARYAGFSESRTVWLVLLLGGGLAGLAGAFEVAGPIGQLIPQITPGYGFTAIIVAFLGRLHPLGIIPAGLLVALSYLGGEAAQVDTGLPRAATGLVQGMLLFFLLASDFVARYRLAFAGTHSADVRPARPKAAAT